MPSFALAGHDTQIVSIARKQVFFQCRFRLPDEIKEAMPFEDSRQIEADITMGFYCDPAPGDVVNYLGLRWGVVAREHWPTRRNTQDKKVVASLILEFIGAAF